MVADLLLLPLLHSKILSLGIGQVRTRAVVCVHGVCVTGPPSLSLTPLQPFHTRTLDLSNSAPGES